MTDIPPRSNRPYELDASVTYPKGVRYSLQWLATPSVMMSLVTPNNLDATFKKQTRKPKPSDLLLHYNYGAAAVKRWGHGGNLFATYENPARPKVPESMRLSKALHDRSIAIQKWEATQGANEAGAINGDHLGVQPGGGTAESRERTRWDEDDIMLFFWGNSPAAIERHGKQQEQKYEYMEQWRQGLQ